MLRSVGWAMLVAGVIAIFIGYPQLSGGLSAQTGLPYPGSGDLGSGLWWITLGGAAAHMGFFFILFGWLGEKIDALKTPPLPPAPE